MKIQLEPTRLKQITERLEDILQKRKGGSANFRGVHFQVLYACYLVLEELKDVSETKSIRLEGIEDIDLHLSPMFLVGNEYIQLKSSINKMDAGTFWSLGVLQNFWELYSVSPDNRFKLVYNMRIADGNLSSLIKRKGQQAIPTFWIEKLSTLDPNIDYDDFINRISFDFQSTNDLYGKILTLFFKDWNVNNGTEIQFFTSLFYNILVWSKDRMTIINADVNQLFQNIRDSYSKAYANKAIQNNWITKTSYQTNNTDSEDYYDGKAARPIHIVLGLPARRKAWEKRIQEVVIKSDVTVIKSSSGQGKSTLAWQVGFNLKENYTIYQLHICRDAEEANSIVEFLESRLLIGEMPLLIIDGLSSSVCAWYEITQRTNDWPIKYLITTRQEDWFRFGADISRINLASVEISLSMQEAKDIFEQFKKRDKIHASIKEWQPVWEQVHDKGLLIEYTYLLTKGEMIQERLSSQLKYLDNSNSSSAKIEILRMTSLADCMNIKLRTSSLINHVKLEIGFEQDRGRILDELEKEYFLNFDGQYIEGLHPVRSNHLKNLLYDNLPVTESLIHLLKIIDVDYKHDFFINAPLLLTTKNKASYYNSLAEQLSESKFSDMVFALDGIMHGEPQRYWHENKLLFDEAYNTGGIELFTMATIPFTELNTLDELANIMGDKGGNFKYLSELKKKLPSYTFGSTDLVLFANELKEKLKKRSSPIQSYEGLEFLIKWFNELKMSVSFPFFHSEIQIDDIIEMDIQESKELILFFQISNPSEFKKFMDRNKNAIISYLKVCTNSLTIEEKEGNIYIQYLLFDNEADRANEFSVSRIQLVHAFLPFYEKYCTEALLLPFPSEEIISVVRQNSIKHLTHEAIGNMFNIHLNQIWLTTIQKNYQEASAYEWQKNILEIRKIAIEWSKSVIQLTDSLLEGNNTKKETASQSISKISVQLRDAIALKRAYPKYEKKYFEQKEYLPEEQEISRWFSSLGNINNQLLNIFLPKEEHDRNVALINLKAVHLNLEKMQEAFRQIENKSIAYFDSESVSLDECTRLERLYTTILYYISQIPLDHKSAVPVARKAVEKWWLEAKNMKLRELGQTLNIVEETSNYEFILPNSLEETETLTYATFGILDFDFSDQDSFFKLSANLATLGCLSIDFFSIIVIKDGKAIGGLRFKKDYFETFEKLLDGEENISMDGLAPLPIFIDEKAISTLPDIKLPEFLGMNQKKENKVKILFDLWKLSEYRKRLDKEFQIEEKWLHTSESECKSNIEKTLHLFNQPSDDFTEFVKKGLESDVIYSKEDIVQQLFIAVQN